VRGVYPVLEMTAATGQSTSRQGPRGATVRDAIVALVAFALTLALLGGRGNATRGLDPLGAVLAAISCFPLLAHRRAPLTVFAVTTAASATINGLGYALGPPFRPTIALFYVANDERTRARLRDTALVLVGLFAIHVGVTRSPAARQRFRSCRGLSSGLAPGSSRSAAFIFHSTSHEPEGAAEDEGEARFLLEVRCRLWLSGCG
jgi:hypothetical protein